MNEPHTTHEVQRIKRGINTQMVTGPDGVSGHVLKHCMDQLVKGFTRIFNLSLSQAVDPTCLKSTTIVPVAKQEVQKIFVLTPIITECLDD